MFKSDELELDKILANRDPKEDGLKNQKIWKDKYHYELLDYNYVHLIEDFKRFSKGGLIKPISVYNEELKSGGIIIKIDKDDKGKYYALLSIFDKYNKIKYVKKLWKIYFDKYYIFYKSPDKIDINDNKTEAFKDLRDKFISKDELYLYENQLKGNNIVDNFHNKYVKKNEV